MKVLFKKIALFLVLMVGAIAAYQYYSEWKERQIGRYYSYHSLRLGMSEVDVTLAYGRNPDCRRGNDEEKILQFDGAAKKCVMSAFLEKDENNKYTVTKICGTAFPPEKLGGLNERELLERLGPSTYTSVHKSGLTKISSFEKNNLAVELQGGYVNMWCITDYLPVKYTDELVSP